MSSSPVSALGASRNLLVRSAIIVEDELDTADLLYQHLSPVAERLEVFRTSSAARRRVAEGPVDLVLLDLNLPDGDGLDLCQQLRRATSEPLIIVLTARTEESGAGPRIRRRRARRSKSR